MDNLVEHNAALLVKESQHQFSAAFSGEATGKQDVWVLKKSGPNGIMTVIIGLKWWAKNKASDEQWEKAVVDVVACLNTFLSSRNKRKGNRDDTHPEQRVAKKPKV